MGKPRDYTGERFGKLVALEPTGEVCQRRGSFLWKFQCDCGEFVDRDTSTVRQSLKAGRIPCCLSCRDSATKQTNTTHGGSQEWLYNRWVKIKLRCTNPKDKDFCRYGEKGIKISEEFLDFGVFREYVESLEGYSEELTIDRIDPSKGYERGNIRWLPAQDQPRNLQFKPKANGLPVGVTYRKSGQYRSLWRGLDGKKKEKSFSIQFYGDELAKFLAEEYRELMISRLRLAGVNYSEHHGKFKE